MDLYCTSVQFPIVWHSESSNGRCGWHLAERNTCCFTSRSDTTYISSGLRTRFKDTESVKEFLQNQVIAKSKPCIQYSTPQSVICELFTIFRSIWSVFLSISPTGSVLGVVNTKTKTLLKNIWGYPPPLLWLRISRRYRMHLKTSD